MTMSRFRLTIVAVASLLAMALLSLAVSRGFNAYRLEPQVTRLLHPPGIDRWVDVADFLAVPLIGAVFVVSVVYGAFRRVLLRVGVLAGFAVAALLISEHIAKPLIQERFNGELSFPSGNVTAVCATALAMWLALYPVLGSVARAITFAFGAVWTLLMSSAVIGAFWHTPLDCIGSVLLSVGVTTVGAAVLPPMSSRAPPVETQPARVMGRV